MCARVCVRVSVCVSVCVRVRVRGRRRRWVKRGSEAGLAARFTRGRPFYCQQMVARQRHLLDPGLVHQTLRFPVVACTTSHCVATFPQSCVPTFSGRFLHVCLSFAFHLSFIRRSFVFHSSLHSSFMCEPQPHAPPRAGLQRAHAEPNRDLMSPPQHPCSPPLALVHMLGQPVVSPSFPTSYAGGSCEGSTVLVRPGGGRTKGAGTSQQDPPHTTNPKRNGVPFSASAVWGCGHLRTRVGGCGDANANGVMTTAAHQTYLGRL